MTPTTIAIHGTADGSVAYGAVGQGGAEDTMALFAFPTVEERLSERWLGGGVQAYMKGVADVFVQTGNIPKALDSYDAFVNTGPLKAAAGE